jgi:cation:H+ antiporter
MPALRDPRALLATAVAATVPGVVIRLAGLDGHLGPLWRSAAYGVAIIGASLLLTWAAEAAELDLPPALAIAGLALIAVLPEYAVGAVFAWRGGHAFHLFGTACQSASAVAAGHDSSCTLALANMMGANRLLIGIGWSLTVLVAWWRARSARGQLLHGVVLRRSHSIELSFLALASVWCLTLPLRHSVSLVDTCVLFAVFGVYTARLLGSPSEETVLEGVAAYVGNRSAAARRSVVAVMVAVAVLVVVLCANTFADALVSAGRSFGVGDFFLVQWVAPLASEAPELVIATVLAWRFRAATGLSALVSSKVNQWTVLVGSLPIAFALASSSAHGLPLAPPQREELALTAAQSVFAVAVLGNLEVSTAEAITLFVLFITEFTLGATLPSGQLPGVRVGFAVTYVVLAAAILTVKRHDTVALVEDGFRTPHHRLGHPR